MSVWLAAIVLWLLPLVFLFPHGESARHAAQANVFFAALYAAILAAGVLCMSRRLTAIARKASIRLPKRDRLANAVVIPARAYEAEAAGRALRRAGYRRVIADPERAWGVRHARSPLGTLLLHASLLLIVVGGVVSLLPGADFVGRTRLSQGERFSGNAAEYYEVAHGSAPSEPLPGPGFVLERVAGTASGDAPPERLDATLVDARNQRVDLSAGLPWIPNPATSVALEDFGMTPRLSLIPSGGVLPSARVAPKLGLSRSGVEEFTEVPVFPYARFRIGVRMVSGADSAPSLRPRVIVTVARALPNGTWRLESDPQTLTVGASRKMGFLTVRLDAVDPNAVLRVSQSPATPFIGLAVLLAAVGPVLRLVLPRSEGMIAPDRGGGVALSVAVDAVRQSPSALARLAAAWEEEV